MMYFKTNLPTWERLTRVIMGIMIIGLAYQYAPTPLLSWVGTAMGVMIAGTGFTGFCPMCAMVGRKYLGTSRP
jgi:hypothetical protein